MNELNMDKMSNGQVPKKTSPGMIALCIIVGGLLPVIVFVIYFVFIFTVTFKITSEPTGIIGPEIGYYFDENEIQDAEDFLNDFD